MPSHGNGVLDVLVPISLLVACVSTPSLTILAFLGWAKDARRKLPRWRAALSLTSVLLTSLNWIALMSMIIIGKTRMPVSVHLDLNVWAPISIVAGVLAATFGVALKGAARVQAVIGGFLMGAIWVTGILIGR
jgi:hypothetical protein